MNHGFDIVWTKFLKKFFITTGFLIVVAWAYYGVGFESSQFRNSLRYVFEMLARFFPPDFSVSLIQVGWEKFLETVQMSFLGTLLGTVLSLPIALLSAKNVAPWPLRWVATNIQSLIRSVPSLVYGMVFVAGVGLGPQAGTLALGVYTIGYLGKFYQEAIENVDKSTLEAFRIMGASRIQTARYAVLPQIFQLGLGYTLYMFEYNIRAASVLGAVGAGGIGAEIMNYIKGFEYEKATTLILFLMILISFIDFVTRKIRR